MDNYQSYLFHAMNAQANSNMQNAMSLANAQAASSSMGMAGMIIGGLGSFGLGALGLSGMANAYPQSESITQTETIPDKPKFTLSQRIIRRVYFAVCCVDRWFRR